MIIAAQIIGILAVAAFLLSYQQKKRKGIILLNLISRFLYILQYLLLGAFSGAVFDVLAAGSSVVAGKKHRKFIKEHIIIVVLCMNAVIIFLGCAMVWYNKSYVDILSLAGVLFEINALWLSSEKAIRWVSLFGAPFWFAYNMISKAYGSAIGNILTIISIVIALIRYKKADDENKNQ
ncbi:MAG: YgjV family protein [Ruminococcaceae bacterium]|nr:YgjV family protein [Oscillospiraceae bacterium]